MEGERKLTDEDVDEIVNRLRDAVAKDFYNGIGQGVFGAVKKAMIVGLIGLIVFLSTKGIKWS
jgi:hypothetical protein